MEAVVADGAEEHADEPAVAVRAHDEGRRTGCLPQKRLGRRERSDLDRAAPETASLASRSISLGSMYAAK